MGGSGFRRLFWGFIFTMIDFNLNGFDVLPDIIGYIFIFLGLIILTHRDERFETARNLCIVILVISALEIIAPGKQEFSGLWILIGIIRIIIDFIMVYNICEGIKNISYDTGYSFIFNEAERAWKHYIGLFIATLCALFLLFIPPIGLVVGIGVFIYSIFVIVVMTSLMARCREAF